MVNKKEVIQDLKFCQQLMDRLVKYADKNYTSEHSYGSNHTVIQNDIQKLRRELMNVFHKLDWNYKE